MPSSSQTSVPAATASSWQILADQVRHAAVAAGFGTGDYRLLRVGTNAVYVNDTDSLVARVASKDVPVADMVLHLGLIAALTASGAPLVAAAGPPANLPDGRGVTFWPRIDTTEQAQLAELVKMVTCCHGLSPITGMRRWVPAFYDAQVVHRLRRARSAGAPAGLMHSLRDAWNTASEALTICWQRRHEAHRDVVLHGDPQPSNTGRAAGTWRLIDCDSVCAGPVEIDLAQIVSYEAHHGDPEAVSAVLAAYPRPVDGELLRLAVRARTVKRCTWVAALWGDRPDTRAVFQRMVESLDDPAVPWPTL